MAHDVFISHSSKDKQTADAVCHHLEQNGIRCWIAPRDILPGGDWAESIVDAVSESRLMILIFSANANNSFQINREINLAAHERLPIVPFRIEDVQPSKKLRYYLGTPHWLDALTPPLEKPLGQLVVSVKTMLSAFPDKIRDVSSPNHRTSTLEYSQHFVENNQKRSTSSIEETDFNTAKQVFNEPASKETIFVRAQEVENFKSQNKKEKKLRILLLLIFIGVGGLLIWSILWILGIPVPLPFLTIITSITGIIMLLIYGARRIYKLFKQG